MAQKKVEEKPKAAPVQVADYFFIEVKEGQFPAFQAELETLCKKFAVKRGSQYDYGVKFTETEKSGA